MEDIPGFPGEQYNFYSKLECEIDLQIACSLRPEPMTKTFIINQSRFGFNTPYSPVWQDMHSSFSGFPIPSERDLTSL